MSLQDAISAESAAIAAHQAQKKGKRVFGQDVGRYAGFKTPGMDTAKIFYDPISMLTDPEKRRASGDQYIWRNPDDVYTKNMVLRGTLRPVYCSEIDIESPYANVHRAKIITKQGPREVIRTPKGLGLFVAPPGLELSNVDQGNLPGEQWEHKYMSDLSDQETTFGNELEQISSSSLQGRVQGEIQVKDTQREMII